MDKAPGYEPGKSNLIGGSSPPGETKQQTIHIAPYGAIFILEIKMLAKELKEKALLANKESIKNRANQLVDLIKEKAQIKAGWGKFAVDITLEQTPHYWKENEARAAGEELSKEGFVCSIDNNVTATYSNTDYDSETVLRVSWE